MLQLREFIRNLQRSNDAIKRRWLIGSSIVAIIVILGGWIAYLHATVPSLAPRTRNAEDSSDARAKNSEESFGKIFSRGVTRIREDVKEEWGKMKKNLDGMTQSLNQTTSPKNQNIASPEHQPSSLENIPMQELKGTP